MQAHSWTNDTPAVISYLVCCLVHKQIFIWKWRST